MIRYTCGSENMSNMLKWYATSLKTNSILYYKIRDRLFGYKPH